MFGELFYQPGVTSQAGVLSNPELFGVAGEAFFEPEMMEVEEDSVLLSQNDAVQIESVRPPLAKKIAEPMSSSIVGSLTSAAKKVVSGASAVAGEGSQAVMSALSSVLGNPQAQKLRAVVEDFDSLSPMQLFSQLQKIDFDAVKDVAAPFLAKAQAYGESFVGAGSKAVSSLYGSAMSYAGSVKKRMQEASLSEQMALLSLPFMMLTAFDSTGGALQGIGLFLTLGVAAPLSTYHAAKRFLPESVKNFSWVAEVLSAGEDYQDFLLILPRFVRKSYRSFKHFVHESSAESMMDSLKGKIKGMDKQAMIKWGLVVAASLGLVAAIENSLGTFDAMLEPLCDFLGVAFTASDKSAELASALRKALYTNLFGGLGTFFLGLQIMSQSLTNMSAERLKQILTTMTKNRYTALLVGLIVTAIIQSSSVTTTLTLSLVDAELITLVKSLGVVFGSNIGTTMTTWFFALKVAKYGLPMIGLAQLISNLTSNKKTETVMSALAGLGLVFVALTAMSSGFKDPLLKEQIELFFSGMSGTGYLDVLKCVGVGALATAIAQSSSATTGIAVFLGQQGIIGYETAAPLAMGANIGTCITVLLASLRKGTSTEARQMAWSHFLFNVFGVAILFPVSPHYIEGVGRFSESLGLDSVGQKIATFHTVFNVFAALTASMFMGKMEQASIAMEAAVRRVVNAVTKRGVEETIDEAARMKSVRDVLGEFNPRLAAAVQVERTKHALQRVARNVGIMTREVNLFISADSLDLDRSELIQGYEDGLDNIQYEFFTRVTQIFEGQVPHKLVGALDRQRRIVLEFERISDDLNKLHDFWKVNLFRTGNGLEQDFPEEAVQEMQEFYDAVVAFVREMSLDLSMVGLESEHPDMLEIVQAKSDVLKERYRVLRQKYVDSPEVEQYTRTPFYNDVLHTLDSVRGHTLNIGQAMAGGKYLDDEGAH